MAPKCALCSEAMAQIKRPATGDPACRVCFFREFESEIFHTLVKYDVFELKSRPADKGPVKVALAVSGGKDSTVLIHVMETLRERYNLNIDFFLLAIDEGIDGYRNFALDTVKRNELFYKLPLQIESFENLFGWSMDRIVAQIGKKSNCTFCGIFRRQALEKGALKHQAEFLCLGHNADDCAETVLMNLLRGDVARLHRSSDVVTGRNGPLPRVRPMMFILEKEIVMYAHFKKLDYFSTECTYSPNAYRGHVRGFIKKLEVSNPQRILDILASSESMQVDTSQINDCGTVPCVRCGAATSAHSANTESSAHGVCKACLLIEGLDGGASAKSMTTTGGRKEGLALTYRAVDAVETATANGRITKAKALREADA